MYLDMIGRGVLLGSFEQVVGLIDKVVVSFKFDSCKLDVFVIGVLFEGMGQNVMSFVNFVCFFVGQYELEGFLVRVGFDGFFKCVLEVFFVVVFFFQVNGGEVKVFVVGEDMKSIGVYCLGGGVFFVVDIGFGIFYLEFFVVVVFV